MWSWARLDVAYGTTATLFGLVSLAYPFGRDQGLYYYAAREWLLRGHVMYRDVWDQKTPVVYLLHMVSIAAFGENMWGIRVLELFIAVPMIAWTAARVATPRGEPVARGVRGAGWMLVSVIYFGCFNFWDTAQCELWMSLFVLAALAVVLHMRRARAAFFLAGFLCGLATFTKPTAAVFVLIVATALLWRVRQDSAQRKLRAYSVAMGLFAAGAVLVASVILGYFAATGAMTAMTDILVGANSYYVKNEAHIASVQDVIEHSLDFARSIGPFFLLFTAVSCTAVAYARRPAMRARAWSYAMPAALWCASYVAVLGQAKFYHYHWGTIVAGTGVFACVLYRDVVRLSEGRVRPLLVRVAWCAGIAIMFELSAGSAAWYSAVVSTIRFERGQITRGDFDRTFDLPTMSYSVVQAELIGEWLHANVRGGDTVAVRGFEPEIYAYCGCWYTGRFFWTSWLTQPSRAYRRQDYLAEDLAELERHPPRFVVALTRIREGVDSIEWFEKLGYRRRRAVLPYFTILERNESRAP